jgi:hypothetical protein
MHIEQPLWLTMITPLNVIDPAKMSDAERMTLFASFTKDLTPALQPRKTIAEQIAPWVAAIRDAHAKGFDWRQLSQVLATNLGIKVSPRTLPGIIAGAALDEGAIATKRRRRRKSKANGTSARKQDSAHVEAPASAT